MPINQLNEGYRICRQSSLIANSVTATCYFYYTGHSGGLWSCYNTLKVMEAVQYVFAKELEPNQY
jgi:hypothetical protein